MLWTCSEIIKKHSKIKYKIYRRNYHLWQTQIHFSLEGKIALITGASYGIGFAIRKSSRAGATIVFNDIKRELVDKGIAAYKEEGIDAHGYVCDVTNEEAVNALHSYN